MIRPDNIRFLSTLPAYINFATVSGTITITGAIANGASQTFSAVIPTTSNNTRFDIYATNRNTNTKQLFTGTSYPVIYQAVSTENVDLFTVYAAASVTISVQVSNFTGAPIVLTNQVYTIEVVEYQIPI